jgi:hypothetical protein
MGILGILPAFRGGGFITHNPLTLLVSPVCVCYALWRMPHWIAVIVGFGRAPDAKQRAERLGQRLVLPTIAAMVCAVLIFFFFNPYMTCGWGCGEFCRCRSNLLAISIAVMNYTADHENAWPTFKDIGGQGSIGDGTPISDLHCSENTDDGPSYIFIDGVSPDAPDWTPIAYCRNWHLYHRHVPEMSVRVPVLLKDGTVIGVYRYNEAEVYVGPARRMFWPFFLFIPFRNDPPRTEEIKASVEAAGGRKFRNFEEVPYVSNR